MKSKLKLLRPLSSKLLNHKFEVRNRATVTDFFSFISMRYTLFAILISGLIGCQSAEENKETTNSSKESTTDGPGQDPAYQQPATTMDSINRLIANDQYNAKLLAIRAKLHLAASNIPAARNDINVAMNVDTNVAVLREAKGELEYMLNHSSRAREEWETCLRLEPNNKDCLMRLTELYIAVQDYDRALELVNRLLDTDDDDAQAYFMKGIIVRDKYQDTALALQYFQNAIDLKQNYYEAMDMMGVMLAARGDTMAKFYYQRILNDQPRRDDIYYKLGVYYMNREETNRALEAYTKAIKINPMNANAYYSMGYIHIELKDYTKARELFTKAINSADRNFRAYYGRGYCYEMLGDVINAKKDYREAIDILPMYKPAQEALARVNRQN